MDAIYLDHNATTPVDPEVLEAMLPYLRAEFGNPFSAYAAGRRAHAAIEEARSKVADLLGAQPDEIVFTGGATEATNLAIRGAVALDRRRTRIITTNIEHPATEACCGLLENDGYTVERVAASPNGIVAADRFTAVVTTTTAIVTVIHAQNEIGTIQPVSEIASAAKASGALVHTDAAQSLGKIPVSVRDLGIDLLTVAGHKLYAPKGIGALYVRRGLRLPPLLVGAGQEHGLRPGTENVAFIVGLGAACAISARVLDSSRKRMADLSLKLLRRLQGEVPGVECVGDPERRLPNTLNVLFPGTSGRAVLEACPQVMASTGSACHAGSEEPSAVLGALGLPRNAALGAVRLSLGRSTTEADIERAASEITRAWHQVRRQTRV
jgi:cysteine desulfurase